MPKPPPPINTPTYRGPDRRRNKRNKGAQGRIRYNAKGDPIWEPFADAPRRRKDDETFDLLKALDVDSLSLADDETPESVEGFNPYERHKD